MTVPLQALPVCWCGLFSIRCFQLETQHRSDLITGRLDAAAFHTVPIHSLLTALDQEWGWPRLVSFSFLWQLMTLGCKDSSDGLLDIKQRQPNIWLHKVQMNHEHVDYISVQIHRDFNLWEIDCGLHRLVLGLGNWSNPWPDPQFGYVHLFPPPTPLLSTLERTAVSFQGMLKASLSSKKDGRPT